MMYEIKLIIKNHATLTIYTSSDIIKDKLIDPKGSIKRTIPISDITCTNTNAYVYSDAIFINNNGKKRMHYDKEYNIATLNIDENELRFPDLVYISLSMFSNILSRKQKYLIHSSSLVHESNNSFILVGDANAGKTSLAYELMSKHNCRLISNDHSIIGIEDDKPMILGGTKDIQMRLGAIELYFPELYKRINIESDNKWNKKIIVNDHIDNNLILSSEEDRALLSDIYSVSTTSNGETFIRRKEKVDELLFLYESLSRIIKGTYNYITGFDYPMPSMEDEKTLYELSEVCKKIVEHVNVSEAKGSVDGLAKTLVKKYER